MMEEGSPCKSDKARHGGDPEEGKIFFSGLTIQTLGSKIEASSVQ